MKKEDIALLDQDCQSHIAKVGMSKCEAKTAAQIRKELADLNEAPMTVTPNGEFHFINMDMIFVTKTKVFITNDSELDWFTERGHNSAD